MNDAILETYIICTKHRGELIKNMLLNKRFLQKKPMHNFIMSILLFRP